MNESTPRRPRSNAQSGSRGNYRRGQSQRRSFNQSTDQRRPRPTTDEASHEDHRGPVIDPSVEARDLDSQARARLRTLSKENSEKVARHLVMAGRLLDEDPQLAYEHAKAALRTAGRVDVVREAAAITAYACGEYSEALREIRAMRRLSGREDLRALEADCERALGRPERAIELIRQTTFKGLSEAEQVELLLVLAGARVDLGQSEIAIKQLQELKVKGAESRYRIDSMLADLTGGPAPIAPEPVAEEPEVGTLDPIFVDLEDEGREFFIN